MEKLQIASSRRQAVITVEYLTERIVKPIEMRVPQRVAWTCRETVDAEEGRRRLEQRVRSQLLFTNEQTGRQSGDGDGDWSKRYNRKRHRVWTRPSLTGARFEDEGIW
jgi:hypothetical protein